MHVRKVTVIFIYLITVVVSFVLAAKESSNKRMPGSTHAFQQMVRYGRSSSKDGNKINVYPRADVFYLGPRYGKRSRSNSEHFEDKTLPCTYTGVMNLFRCSPRLKQENRM